MHSLSILVAVAGAPDGEDAIAVAADLAYRHASTAVVVNLFAPVPMVAAAPGFAGGVMSPQVWQALEEREDAIKIKVAALVGHESERFGLGGDAGRMIVALPRETPWASLTYELPLVDLVVAAQSSVTGEGPWNGALSQALMEARAPVYIARDMVSAAGRPAAVAWDGGFEAARAVRAALPLLRDASEVAILQDPEGLDTSDGARADPRRLMEFLSLHGVATQTVLEAHGRKIGPALLAAAKTFNAALLVSGAFRHSRLEEAIFGGATRALLAEADGPHLLIAH